MGVVFFLAACTSPRQAIVSVASPPVAILDVPGVDSSLVAQASALAEVSFAKDAEAAARLTEAGRRLVLLADSLLSRHTNKYLGPPESGDSVQRDVTRGIEAFNEGAEALAQYAEADSVRAGELLEEAAAHFEEALLANPFDTEARYWLARTFEIMAEHLHAIGAVQAAIDVLQRLVTLHQDRHDYIALLAAAYEHIQTEEADIAAGALWGRAALVAQDDVLLASARAVVADTGAIFTYYVRGSRAFVQADRSDLALRALRNANNWVRSPDDAELVSSETAWINWDDGNLANRKEYDSLLETAAADPVEAAEGLEELMQTVTQETARIDVQHQLALTRYASGEHEAATILMQTLWKNAGGVDSVRAGRIREDFATMAYNLAQVRRRAGDLPGALAYLLQCERVESQVSARAALQAAQLLQNNLDAALKRALVAEARMEHLTPDERESLLRYIVELYRRKGDRENAKHYVRRLVGEL